jgi:hypothetical protein
MLVLTFWSVRRQVAPQPVCCTRQAGWCVCMRQYSVSQVICIATYTCSLFSQSGDGLVDWLDHGRTLSTLSAESYSTLGSGLIYCWMDRDEKVVEKV